MVKITPIILLAMLGSAALQPSVHAQGNRMMPDGSRDAYVGLALASAPRWDGAAEWSTSIVPALQVERSSGIFIAGNTVGMHLSSSPAIGYGPLLSVQTKRDLSGQSGRTWFAASDNGLTILANAVSAVNPLAKNAP